jgi:transcriptional regulator with XRE-family HTH domain
MPELRNYIGTRIRAIRNAKGLTQQNLADASGLDYRYIGALERGERNFSMDTLEKVVLALNVTLKDLALVHETEKDSLRQETIDEFAAMTENLTDEQISVLRIVNREVHRGMRL